MLRKLALAAVLAGGTASVPIFIERNPEAVNALLGRDGGAQSQGAVTLMRAEPEPPRREQLSGRKVRLDADGRGHYSADFRLNGRGVEALVDTGASVIAINQSTARRLGLKLSASDFTGAVQTANGRARAARAMIDRVEIGRIDVRNVEAVVLEDAALSGTLIGMSFLSKLRRFHVEGGSLVMEQ